jgi:site-specific DNA-methyltransferase (adenine-specific)
MIKLLCGDMFEELKKVNDKSVDLVFLDLPYGQTNCKWDKRIDLEKLWLELKRVGKSTTAYIFFCTTLFGYEIIKSNEKWFRYDLIWYKPNSTAGHLNAKKMPMRSHEMIYLFYEKLPFYNIADNHNYFGVINPTYSNTDKSVYMNNTQMYNSGGSKYVPKLPTSVLNVNVNKGKRKHNTEKPIELFEWFLKYYLQKDGTCLDVCFGSGNSSIACKNLNRNYIGIEIDETYYKNAVEHLELLEN